MKKLILAAILFLFPAFLHAEEVLIVFHSKLCAPCRQLKQELERPEYQTLLKDYKVYDVDIQKNRKVMEQYKVRMVPTLIKGKMKDGKLADIEVLRGFNQIKLKEFLK